MRPCQGATGSKNAARRGTGTRGFTLIELVVALAVFALIAVMGLQALTGTLRMRDALIARDTQAMQMARATTLLRRDLRAAVPLLFFPPGGAPLSAVASGPDRLALSLAGQPVLADPAARARQRAVWRVDPATRELRRSLWPRLDPVAATEAAPEVTLLGDVTALRLRSYWPGQGWRAGSESFERRADVEDQQDEDGGRAQIASPFASTLPEAIEVTLEIADFGQIVLVESLK